MDAGFHLVIENRDNNQNIGIKMLIVRSQRTAFQVYDQYSSNHSRSQIVMSEITAMSSLQGVFQV